MSVPEFVADKVATIGQMITDTFVGKSQQERDRERRQEEEERKRQRSEQDDYHWESHGGP
jgi:hypothetical protein